MNRYALSAALALTFCAPARADYISQVLGDNPLGFWILNDVAGGPLTRAIDSTVTGFDGTYELGVTLQGIAGPSWLPPSDFVADFTGGTISFSAPLSLGTNGYTIEAWVYPSALSLTQTTRIVASGNGLGGYGFGTASDGRLVLTSFNVPDYFTRPLVLSANQWQSVAVVLDASNDASFFVNGSFIQSVTGLLPTIPTTSNFTFGNESPGVGHADEIYTGGLAGISVYGRVLTPAQIQAQFDAAQAVEAIPEPATTVLMALPVLFLAPIVRHRKRENRSSPR